MINKMSIWLFIFLVVKVFSQYGNEVVAENASTSKEDPSMINHSKAKIASYNSDVDRIKNTLENELIKNAKVVQENTDKYLDKFSVVVSEVLVKAGSSSAVVTTTTTVAPNTLGAFKDIAAQFANKIRQMKEKVHKKMDTIIDAIKISTNKVQSEMNSYINDFSCKVDTLKQTYPGIDSKECMAMYDKFKSGVVAVLEISLNCVKDRILSSTNIVDGVDDFALSDLRTRYEDLRRTWQCVVETDGGYFYKFVNCVNVGSVKAAWTLLSALTMNMDKKMDEIIDKAEKSITITNCIGSGVRDGLNTQYIEIIESLRKCSTQITTAKPDFSKCQLPIFMGNQRIYPDNLAIYQNKYIPPKSKS